MSDNPPGPKRNADTLSLRAALVLPDDVPPAIGLDTVRIPVKIVWREADEVPEPEDGTGPDTASRQPDRPGQHRPAPPRTR